VAESTPGSGNEGAGPPGVSPGALSALLQEIAAAPQGEAGAWEAALRPGAVFGKFELVREIGRGGFGVVWEARDRELGRGVAFKAVRAGGQVGLREERLLREAEAAARLTHPNIVTLHDLGRAAPGPYLVLELLRGQTLEARLAQGRLSLREAVRVAAEVAKGMAHAHGQGVVHRDLKPGNVFLCHDGQVKVLDFGLAHAFGQRRQAGGTPAYMAPEQWQGAPEDERTDVFALGVILFELLTGEAPFADEKALRSAGAAPRLEVPDLPGLADLVTRMLEKGPVARPRDGREVMEVLRALQGELERTPSSPAAPVTARRRPRLRLAGMVAAGILLGALAAGAISWWRYRGAPAPVAGADGRIVIAVADFANETGERELDALSGLLITALEQSRRVAVLPRGRLFDLARERGHRNVTRIDEVIGRDVVRAAGAKALLVAAVHRFGGLYAVELRALDPQTDAYLFTLKEQAMGKEAIPELIDRLADRARSAFREEAPDPAAPPAVSAKVVAGSLDAYQHVFQGLQLYFDDGEPGQAVAAMNRALRVDPGLASAHLWLAVMGDFNDAPGEDAEEHLAAATAAAPRLPGRERALVAAWQAYHDGQQAQAREMFARLVADHPFDKEVVFLAAMSAFHGSNRRESEVLLVKALELDPGFSLALYRLCDLLAMQGRTAEGVARARAAVAAKPNLPNQLALAMALGRAGDLEKALETARRAKPGGSAPDFEVTSMMALAQAGLGRLAEAESSVRPWTRDDAPDPRGALRLLAELLAMQGRRTEALAALRRMQEVAPGYRIDWKTEVQFLGVGGRSDAVREYLQGRRIRDPSWSGTFAYFGLDERAAELARGLVPGTMAERAYRANVAWRAGRPAERLEFLREQIGSMPNVPAAFLLGEALAASGSCAEAVVEFQRVERLFVSRFTIPWRPSYWAESLVRRARCLAELGRTAEASTTLDRFLATWKRADPDLPLLAEAQQLRGRLQEPGRPRQ
jgi:tetratricopeptide (TPR) repeat protein